MARVQGTGAPRRVRTKRLKMLGVPTSFWGKLAHKEPDRKGPVVAWHPLVDHCADVSACCRVLLEVSGLRRRLARLGGREDLSAPECDRLAILAALHDLGKFNIGFQDRALPNPSSVAGHVTEGIALVRMRRKEVMDALGLGPIEGELLFAALAHHGEPISVDAAASRANSPLVWKARRGLDPFEGMRNLGARVREWLPGGVDVSMSQLASSEMFGHGFAGLVTFADWLGSDTSIFPFSEPNAPARFGWACDRARDHLRATGIDPAAARECLGDQRPSFEAISKYSPRPLQEAVGALAPIPALTFLEAETGAGKTEAALLHYLALFQAGAVDGLYFALPTRTAATELHDRIVEAIARAFPNAVSRPPVVLAVPGYLAVDDATGKRLPGFEVLWGEEGPSPGPRGWAAEQSKRYLLGAIAVGTIDQVLLSTIQVKHAHMRATALLRHLLVVDEVHASDTYMTRLLERVLRRHLGAGGYALLMSATLGRETRQRLERCAPGVTSVEVGLEESAAVPYPLLSVAGGRPQSLGESGPGKEVAVSLVSCANAPDIIAVRALEAARAGAKVLVIRNTVKDCISLQRALEREDPSAVHLFTCAGRAAPHHSRFAREDRILLDKELKAVLGKGTPPRGVVVAATQTVQQSLDIDADLLITDLCPMDVLLQRIGRLQRHPRARPFGFERPNVVVLAPEKTALEGFLRRGGDARGEHGLGSVYEDLCVIEATRRTLARHAVLNLPSMNRMLVERATHPEALDEIAQTNDAWKEHRVAVQGRYAARGMIASLGCVDWSTPYCESDFPRGLEERVQTRLGIGDWSVDLGASMRGPFGDSIRQLSIPAHLAPNGCADTTPRNVDQSTDVISFELGEGDDVRGFAYTRIGLERID